MRCFPSVSEQAETSPWAESCARAVTLKEKARQLVLVSESRGSRGKVSSASNPVGAGYINSQVLSSSFPFPVSVALIYVFSFLAVYHAIYLEEMAASEVTRKLALAFNIPLHQINQVYRQGPTGIHILVSDQVMEILFFRKKSYEFSKMEFFSLILCCYFVCLVKQLCIFNPNDCRLRRERPLVCAVVRCCIRYLLYISFEHA